MLGALIELLPQQIANAFPPGKATLNRPPFLMGWKEHYHPRMPVPRHCVSPGAEGKCSANMMCQ